jgi:hypothetical protein
MREVSCVERICSDHVPLRAELPAERGRAHQTSLRESGQSKGCLPSQEYEHGPEALLDRIRGVPQAVISAKPVAIELEAVVWAFNAIANHSSASKIRSQVRAPGSQRSHTAILAAEHHERVSAYPDCLRLSGT